MKVFLKKMLKTPKGKIGKIISSEAVVINGENVFLSGETEFGVKLTLNISSDQIKKII